MLRPYAPLLRMRGARHRRRVRFAVVLFDQIVRIHGSLLGATQVSRIRFPFRSGVAKLLGYHRRRWVTVMLPSVATKYVWSGPKTISGTGDRRVSTRTHLINAPAFGRRCLPLGGPRIQPVFSVVAPCPTGASPPSVPRPVYEMGSSTSLVVRPCLQAGH